MIVKVVNLMEINAHLTKAVLLLMSREILNLLINQPKAILKTGLENMNRGCSIGLKGNSCNYCNNHYDALSEV